MEATPAKRKVTGNKPYIDYDPCTAKAKTTGKRCTRRPAPGCDVCVKHGGAAAQVREAGRRRLAAQALEADAKATLAREGVASIDDPVLEMGLLASEAKALAQSLGQRVNALTDIEVMDAKNAPHLRVTVELYERALDRTHRILDSLVRHGYTERQVRIAEGEALIMAGVLRRVISGLGLTDDQRRTAQALLAQEFRALDETPSTIHLG